MYAEWNNKAAGFVSYGGVGGARAAEQLRLICRVHCRWPT
jgi:NAD(P)H-dependent FMN reductase